MQCGVSDTEMSDLRNLVNTRFARNRVPPLQTLLTQFRAAPGYNTVDPESSLQPSPRKKRAVLFSMGVI